MRSTPSLGFLFVMAMAASVGMELPLLADDPPLVTWPAETSDEEDGEVEIEPANLDYTPTLGDPILPSVDEPWLANVPRPPEDDEKAIYPIGLMELEDGAVGDAQTSTNVHYLSYTYRGAPVVLVGVSADNACHFIGTGTAQCRYGTGSRYGLDFKPFIDDLRDQGLNSLRLWVSIVGGNANQPTASSCPGIPPATTTSAGAPLTNDNPFKYSHTNLVNGVGRWHLDDRDTEYFKRLAEVVRYARDRNIIVEVTLFSPLTGHIGIGPYGRDHAYLRNGTRLAGFTDTANFTNISSGEYSAMKPYVENVIRWTVDALYQFPNVYFEVANEPENGQFSSANGCGRKTATSPATVAAWQAEIARVLTTYERNTYVTPRGPLARPHLVAVEPATKSAAATFVSGGAHASAGQIINSHYTNLAPQVNPDDGLGAITMIRLHNNQPKIFGFNETKITGGACGGNNTGGSVEAGRAEAWEFLLGQGGVYNQYGYDCTLVAGRCAANPNAAYCRTRAQMGALRRFLVDQLVNVVYGTRTSAPVDNPGSPQTSGTRWINVGSYPTLALPSNTTGKFWAALEPTNNAANKRWLLYVHHSQRRNLPQGGYLAVTGTYQEQNLSVCLAGGPQGTYYVRWYTQPAVAQASSPNRIDTISWTPRSCTPGGANAVPLPASPPYSYDLALLISREPPQAQ